LIFISLARDAIKTLKPPTRQLPRLPNRKGMARARVAKIMDFEVDSNWKLVWENNRECYHCNVNHPQYIKANFDHYNADDTLPRVAERLKAVTTRLEAKLAEQGMYLREETGMTEFPDPEHGIWYAANRTPLVEGYVSESMDGKQVAPLMGDYTDPEVGNAACANPAQLLGARQLRPQCGRSPDTQRTDHTSIRMIWLVDGNAEEGRDYDLEKLLPFWLLTAEQDWAICPTSSAG
jgi:Rieske 2Fe-2S family protein